MNNGAPTSNRRHYDLAFAAILAAWLVANLFNPARSSLWFDETRSILSATAMTDMVWNFLYRAETVATSSDELSSFLFPESLAGDFLAVQAKRDIHPPLYFFLLRMVMWAGAREPAALSLLSLFFAGLSASLLYLTARRHLEGPYPLLVPVFFMAGIPGVDMAAEIRQYGLLFLFAALLTWLALGVAHDPERSRRPGLTIALAATLAGGALTQYMFAFLAAAVYLWLLSRPEVRANRQLAIRLVAAGAAALVMAMAWAPFAATQFGAEGIRASSDHIDIPDLLENMVKVFLNFFVTPASPWGLPLALALTLTGFAMAKPPCNGFRSFFLIAVAVCLILPALLRWANVIRIEHLFNPRYFICLAPAAYLAAASGAAALPSRWLRALVPAALLAMVVINHLFFLNLRITARDPAQLGSGSDIAAVIELVKQKSGKNFAVVLDRPQEALPVAVALGPGYKILAGNCPALPGRLADRLIESRSPAVLYLHDLKADKEDPGCGEEFSKILEGFYGPALLKHPAQGFTWSYYVIGARPRP